MYKHLSELGSWLIYYKLLSVFDFLILVYYCAVNFHLLEIMKLAKGYILTQHKIIKSLGNPGLIRHKNGLNFAKGYAVLHKFQNFYVFLDNEYSFMSVPVCRCLSLYTKFKFYEYNFCNILLIREKMLVVSYSEQTPREDGKWEPICRFSVY